MLLKTAYIQRESTEFEYIIYEMHTKILQETEHSFGWYRIKKKSRYRSAVLKIRALP